MYINFNGYRKHDLDPQLLVLLLAVKWQDIETISNWSAVYKDNEEYFSFIKGKKSQSEAEKIRLSSRGKTVFDDLNEADVEEEDIKVFDWLSAYYKELGKEIGNKAKTKRHIRDFRLKSGISKNKLVVLCKEFVNDEENMNWNFKLEYCFYKAPTAFETRFQLEESRLYKYYLKRQDEFDKVFKQFNEE